MPEIDDRAMVHTTIRIGIQDTLKVLEAFRDQHGLPSIQMKSCIASIGLTKDDILNVNGGAVALGHPVGMTGTRLVLTVLHELRQRKLQRGLATLCIGGGQGAALLLEVE